jgi:hypothetical protein
LTAKQLTDGVAAYYKKSTKALRKISRGQQTDNQTSKISMCVCHELSVAKLRVIVDFFKLNHASSVGFITHQIRQKKLKKRFYCTLG